MKIEQIINNTKKFYEEIEKDESGRYKSWEYCYSIFYNNINNELTEELLDYLSLNLSMYLASWGMYRGSSFLLQKNYKIHKPVIKEIFKEEYRNLLGIDCKEYLLKENQNKLKKIVSFIEKYYEEVRKNTKNIEIKKKISYTLVTKILLGIFGCVPAYDRYFIAGVKKLKVTTGIFNVNSVLKISSFYKKYEKELEQVRSIMTIENIKYPQMKLIDLCFWKVGYELDSKILK